MDLPSSSERRHSWAGRGAAICRRGAARAALLAWALLLPACGRHAVRASEKEHLADRIMQFDEDAQESAAEEHVRGNREGSTGRSGSAGGGCGCN